MFSKNIQLELEIKIEDSVKTTEQTLYENGIVYHISNKDDELKDHIIFKKRPRGEME